MNGLSPSTKPFSIGSQSKKTVLYFDHTAHLGGGEVALLHLVCGLDRARFHPVVVLGSEGALQHKLIEAGVETHILPMALEIVQTRKNSLGLGSLLRLAIIASSFAYAWRLSRFIRDCQAALIHTNSLKADIIGGVAAYMARVPVLWHVRDRIETDYLPAPVVWLFRKLCRWFPHYVIANSAATLETLSLPPSDQTILTNRSFSRVRSRVVHDGVRTTDAFDLRSSVTRPPVIGLIGRISPWKGQHIFLQMAAIVRARFPNTRFQICGSALFGEEIYEAELHALTQHLRVQDCVEFLGFRTDVPEVIHNLDILVHASTIGEPFGQVIIEGMMAHKPVVATRGGGVPEIVQDGVTGYLVPMGDAEAMAACVLQLLADPQKAQEMGQAGYQRVQEHFTIELTVQRIEAIYSEILTR